ncbi:MULTISPECIES: hypothetical protein [unclassified Rhodococcus (in: high G+C Gram-positive bacteria)]|uniref:hypothetical protein n=1 Tax=unclassified Rhodococcus (in: high G+C Gram-positive bacteria) TaxID=192944 RepID=UPI00163A2742|nr:MULTISPECIES: hypothetical protein [unclassified Rhodococcus (in: high G+C Gram-positive bacteria)]MBC2640802.1 hypothetical protein [Rhodococcus sp. 3A]MBC2894453.1 hypothetical protein [Rhodococcus sp. 4CII]
MKKKIAWRAAAASAVIAPAMVFAAGTAEAVPALSVGATGSGAVTVTVPAGENWTCFGFDSGFSFKSGAFAAGVGTLGGFARGSNVTLFCFGNQAPFFFTGSVTVR